MAVIDQLEVVQIQERQRKRAAAALAALSLGLHQLGHAAAVDQAREFVVRRQVADLFERYGQGVLLLRQRRRMCCMRMAMKVLPTSTRKTITA